ncbi:hypothetical protein [Roseicyclus persicicus]|uniref:FeoB-associated Cys-rich membrane protein n=1 Tax=Roseicyclus persicicus TaxID=2650661 RepID=A0A7X6JYF8_9RHOB|nr:hypothetical protein [Roseibacterium persicicum]NKX43753.1 hypothetical protein [Roseibacterium persicicum]
MELLIAVPIFLLAAGGLGLGLLLGGRAPRASCGGQDSCAAGPACAGCPKARARRQP